MASWKSFLGRPFLNSRIFRNSTSTANAFARLTAASKRESRDVRHRLQRNHSTWGWVVSAKSERTPFGWVTLSETTPKWLNRSIHCKLSLKLASFFHYLFERSRKWYYRRLGSLACGRWRPILEGQDLAYLIQTLLSSLDLNNANRLDTISIKKNALERE